MHRNLLLVLCLLAGLLPVTAKAQILPQTADQIHQLELLDQASAQQWARNANFPMQLRHQTLGSAALIRLEHNHPVFFTTHNQAAAARTHTSQLHSEQDFGFKLSGIGLTVGIWDEGAVLEDHQELDFRINLFDMGGASNHATHVAGTLAARGEVSEAKGMAPSAHIISYNWNFHASETQTQPGVSCCPSPISNTGSFNDVRCAGAKI